jgi:hypothetical protein
LRARNAKTRAGKVGRGFREDASCGATALLKTLSRR